MTEKENITKKDKNISFMKNLIERLSQDAYPFFLGDQYYSYRFSHYTREEFIKNGKFFIGRVNSNDIKKEMNFKPIISQCWSNAQMLSESNDDMKYFEGFVVSSLEYAIEHAFNVTSDHQVVDITFEQIKDEKDYGKLTVYFGIETPYN